RGLLRHDAAVTRVQLSLRGDHVRLNRYAVAHDGDRGLIAACLDAQDARHNTGVSKTRTPEATSPNRRWPSRLDWIRRTPARAGSRSSRINLPSRATCRMRAPAGSARYSP